MNLNFAQKLERFGDLTAVRLADGTTISYRQLALLADNYAQRFVQCDVWPQQICALLCRNNLTTLIAYLCCLRHQRPVLLLNARVPQSQLDLLVRQLEIAAVIDDLGQMQRVSPTAFRARADLAILLSSSAAIWDARSVMLSLENLQQNALAISRILPLQRQDIAISAMPFFTAYSLSVINSHLLCGGQLLLTDFGVSHKEFWQLLNKHQVSSLSLTPGSLAVLQKIRFEQLPVPALRYLTFSGASLTVSQQHYVCMLQEKSQRAVYLLYGQTESTACISWLRPEYLADYSNSIGEALPGGELTLADPQTQTEIRDTGQQGELVYRGANVMLGYAQHAADLRSNDKLSILRTGDLATRLPSGFYLLTGKTGRRIKILDRRLELDLLEKRLQRERWNCICTGQDNALVVAVIDADAASTTPAQVEQYLLQYFPATCFKLILLRDIPYNTAGKINYLAIEQMAGEC